MKNPITPEIMRHQCGAAESDAAVTNNATEKCVTEKCVTENCVTEKCVTAENVTAENVTAENIPMQTLRKCNLPIFIPHLGCPHSCAFCNQKKIFTRFAVIKYQAMSIMTWQSALRSSKNTHT